MYACMYVCMYVGMYVWTYVCIRSWVCNDSTQPFEAVHLDAQQLDV